MGFIEIKALLERKLLPFLKMNEILWIFIATVIGVLLMFNGWIYYLDQKKALEQLCVQNAREYYRKKFNANEQGFRTTVKPHYHHEMRTCFVNIHYFELNSTDDSKLAMNVYDYLVDVDRQKQLAYNIFTTYKEIAGYKESFERCYVNEKRCFSQEEYDSFVDRYMQRKR
jgi:hypothetical protein